MMQEIWDATQKKFAQFEEQLKFTISLTFDDRLNHRSSVITVNQSLTPMSVNDVGQMCLAMCLVSISSQSQSGNVFLDCGDDKRWEYSFKLKKWVEKEIVSFSGREREVLLLSARGKNNKEIAQNLFIDITTVKTHKYHLFRKLGSNNICKALGFLHRSIFFR